MFYLNLLLIGKYKEFAFYAFINDFSIRLLLVLHGSWRYLHEIQINILPHTIDSSSTANQQSSLSVGLVVKKYWNKLLHLSTVLQQHEVRGGILIVSYNNQLFYFLE